MLGQNLEYKGENVGVNSDPQINEISHKVFELFEEILSKAGEKQAPDTIKKLVVISNAVLFDNLIKLADGSSKKEQQAIRWLRRVTSDTIDSLAEVNANKFQNRLGGIY